MAAAADNSNHSLNTCPVCLDDLFDMNRSPVDQKKPRALHCLHTMCEECLHSLALQTHYREIRCPTCRHVTPLLKGVAGLPVNYYIRNLHEATAKRQTNERTSVTKCTTCSYDGKTSVAAVKCKECELNLCEPCRDKHNEFSALFRGHSLHILGSSRCATHDKDIEYVCKSCRQELCPACLMTGNHGNHLDKVASCKQINDEAHVQSQFMQIRLQQVNRDVGKAHEMERMLLNIRRSVQEWCDNLQDQIKTYVENVVRSLQMRLLACNYQRLMQEQHSLQTQAARYDGMQKQQGPRALLSKYMWTEDIKEEMARSTGAQWHPSEDIPVLTMDKREVPWPTITTKKRPAEEMVNTSAGESTSSGVSSQPSTSGEGTPKKIKVEVG